MCKMCRDAGDYAMYHGTTKGGKPLAKAKKKTPPRTATGRFRKRKKKK